MYGKTIKKQQPKATVLTQKNKVKGYRSLSTDFTSLSSLRIKIFAISKQITPRNGKMGSIPFSGKSIPPDKFCSQYTNIPINNAFIIMLVVFSNNCLFLFLKLKRLKKPNITTIGQVYVITVTPFNNTTSCAVINKNTADITAKSIQIDCILCNIVSIMCTKVI